MRVEFPERASPRPTWLLTLADLALLLVGFFVLLQTHASGGGRMLAGAMRERFGDKTEVAAPVRRAMPVAAAALPGFTPGSAALPSSPRAVIDWALDAARDPRTMVTITGAVDGTAADVDPVTGSGAVLAADRARALLAVLAPAFGRAGPHGRPSSRLAIATATTPGRRAATVTVGFTGSQP